MRRAIVALCGLCLTAPVIAGQGAPPQQTPPVFRGGVTLVTVDVTVLDKDGKPVAGLTADDFTVKLDNQVRPVRALDYLKAAGKTDPTVQAQGQAVTQSRQTVMNAPPTSESRVFVILVDDLSYEPVRGRAMFAAARRFVAGLPAADYVGFATSSGLEAVNPTTDRAAIETALKSAVGEFSDPRTMSTLNEDLGIGTGLGIGGDKGGDPLASGTFKRSVGVQEALEIDNGTDARLKEVIARECFNGVTTTIDTQGLMTVVATNACASHVQTQARRIAALTKHTTGRQLRAFQAVIDAMRPAPGIKHLVLMSDGLGVFQDVASFEPVARAAAAAGVQVSVLAQDPDSKMAEGGFGSPQPVRFDNAVTMGPDPAARRREDDKMFMSGIQTVADVTGGTFYRVIGTPDPFFERVATAASGVYRLGIEPPSNSAAGRDFAVVVTVRRSGVTLHANRHAVAPGPPVVVPIDEQLRTAVASGRPAFSVPIGMATAMRRTTGAATLDLGVNVQVPGSVKGPLTTMFGIVDDAGTLRTGRRVVEAPPAGGDFRISFGVPVTPGRYRVRFAVADAEGHVGSIESVVNAQLQKIGTFFASDLLTLWLDPTGKAQFLALEEVPAGAVMLNGSLEFYPSQAGQTLAGVHVRMLLMAAGQTSPAIERDIVPDSAGRAAGEFSIASLPAGAYTLRAIVTVNGAEVGAVSTTIRKR